MKIFGGLFLVTYWGYVFYLISATEVIGGIIGAEMAIIHIFSFVLIIVGWIEEERDRENVVHKQAEIQTDLDKLWKEFVSEQSIVYSALNAINNPHSVNEQEGDPLTQNE